MKEALAICAVAILSVAVAFRPEMASSPAFWWITSIAWISIGAWACWRLVQAQRLKDLMTPRMGDLTMGVLLGIVLLGVSWLGRTTLAPHDSERFGWLLNIYLLIGPPDALQTSLVMNGLLLVLVVSQELVFRGWIQEKLLRDKSPRAAWLISAALYTAIALPTVFTLRSPGAGLNPLLVLMAFVAGLGYGFARLLSGRLPPVLVAHGFFTYFTVMQFRLPGL